MKFHFGVLAGVASLSMSWVAFGEAGPFYGAAPDEHHPWAIHDRNRPQPKIVTPGTCSSQELPGKAPSDAVVLFNGTDLSQWEADKDQPEATKWIIRDGAMECVPGSGFIRTKEKFGDCQLHVEWAAPVPVHGDGQGRGNSGVFLMGIMEVQVLDNYNNPSYADGMAGSVYDMSPPMANALRPPGQFQSYDIVFRRPIYKDGKPVDPGYVTVFVNGVLVQDHTMIEGTTGHMTRSKPQPFPEIGALKFQDHGNPVRYRNVWYRPLPPRAVEGGTDGYLTKEATKAKRSEIAASLRKEADQLTNPADSVTQMLRFAESLVYEKDTATFKKVGDMANQYVADLKQLPADKLNSKKDEVIHVRDAFRYLVRWHIVRSSFKPKADLEQIVTEQKWEKKR